MRKPCLLFIFLITVIPFTVVANKKDSALNQKVAQWANNPNGLRFLENKGQMFDMQRNPVPNVLYEASGGGMDMYVTNTGLSYIFVKLEKHGKKNGSPIHFKEHNDSITETWCRADMQLVGASIKKENIVREGESANRTDYYYGGVCPDGILNVHSYTKVTIKNVYPGIDWVLHSGKNGLKYDFVVHPGADPSQIKLKYKWADKPQLQDDGSVKISTPMGNITEGIPVSYCNGEQVQTAYAVNDSEIHFNLGDYNTAQSLTIDPVLVWGTYFGGSRTDDILSMQEDGKNVWLTGLTTSTNYPTLNPGNGAYFQGTVAANGNIWIAKFNTNGVLQWSTSYGGNGGDIGTSICSDGTHIWVAGGSSSPNFPTLNPGGGAYYQGTLAGSNAVILEFDTAGARIWATFYGGTNGDGANSICSDGTNVWVTGDATSTNFPVFNPGGGAYFQSTLGAVGGNAFILQFTTTGVRKWATYYGGSGFYANPYYYGDGASSIQSDGIHVWVTGYTESTNFPVFNPGNGAYFQSGGAGNAFILKFTTSGIRQWATYFGGSSSAVGDWGYSIYSDGNHVLVTGAAGSNNFPTLNPGGGAYFDNTHTALGANVFISRFDTGSVLKWSTYYGGTSGDVGNSIQTDGTSIWVGGQTSSPDFPTLSTGCGFNDDTLGGSYQTTLDPFILQFSMTGVLKWATFYGITQGNPPGYPVYLSSDGTDLFIAGGAWRNNFPTVNPGGGAYFQGSLPGTGSIFIGKLCLTCPNPFQVSVNPTITICRGDTASLSAGGGTFYNWNPPTGLNATNIPNPLASPKTTTTYTVIATDTTGGCPGKGIDSVKIIVDTTLSGVTINGNTTVCSGTSVSLNATGGTTYTWSNGATGNSIFLADDSVSNIYKVSISKSGCKKDTSVQVTVIPKPKGTLTGNLYLCKGNSTVLKASGGSSYIWNTGDTTGSITVSPSASKTYSVKIIQNGCADTLSALVAVSSFANINTCCDSSIIYGQNIQLISSGATSYSWSPSSGLSCTDCPNPIASPQHTTIYTVVVSNDSGCISEQYITIDVHCGDVFIPDVFAPNETAHNNILYVRGTCIASLDFEVFDRWGNRVFETKDKDNGWNGNINGSPMNTGTYIWLLKATMLDGTTVEKKGNVTLVR